MTNTTHRIRTLLVLILCLGVYGFMGIKTEITGAWLERFNDVEKFNTYAAGNKVSLSDAIIKNKTTTGVILTGATFSNTEWEKVDFFNSHITSTVFEDSDFTEVDFKNSIMTDVVFKNCKLIGTNFDEAKLVNVKFINCDFLSSGFFKIKQSKIEFENTDFERVTFSKAQAQLSFLDSKLVFTHLTGLKAPTSLSFTKSELDIDFSRSTIDKLEITDSISHRAGGGSIRMKELILKGNKGDRLNFGDSMIDRITIENADMTDQIVGLVNASVKDLLVVNSKGEIAAIDANFGKIKILNSPKVLIDMDGATAE
ncbi:MAG TPA: hypothetical protein ENH23_07405, partial [candidate division Zixibacteria bacterium]|nr:hypothetical protein [candidate division Zixibacteria bacterium]